MRPEDRPKAIGLVVGVVVVFGLVGMRMKAALGGGEVPPPAQTTVALSGSGGAAAAPASSGGNSVVIGTGPGPAAGSDKDAEKPIVIQPTKGSQNNPFRTFEGKGQKPTDIYNPDIIKSKPTPPVVQTTPETLPPVNKSPLPVPGAITGLEIEKDNAPDMQVTGILTGGRAVAVIRMGGKTYVVSQGETFANGFKLISATGYQIVVSQGLFTKTLKMDIPMG